MYDIDGYNLFRNDGYSLTSRPFGGMAVFSRVEFLPGYPCCQNVNGIEITIMKVMILPQVTIVGIYRSPAVPVQQLLEALSRVLNSLSSQFNIFIGDFISIGSMKSIEGLYIIFLLMIITIDSWFLMLQQITRH